MSHRVHNGHRPWFGVEGRSQPYTRRMWWILIPGAAAAAYKLYDTLREQPESPHALPEQAGPQPAASGDPADPLPRLEPILRRWAGHFGSPDRVATPDSVTTTNHVATSDDHAAPSLPTRKPTRRRLRPSHLTAGTAIALVVVTWLLARSPSVALDWTQAVLLGALIGIGTNWVAIKMLFRPKERILGLQGLVPANRDAIVEQIAQGVAANLLDRETIRAAVHESNLVQAGLDDMIAGLQRVVRHADFRNDLNDVTVAYVSAFVNSDRTRQAVLDALASFARRAPEHAGGFARMFSKEIGSWLEAKVHQYRDAILTGLEKQSPAIVNEVTEALVRWLETLPTKVEARRAEVERFLTEHVAERAASFDIQGIIRQRLQAYSTDDLEALILNATDDHLVRLQVLGWFIGAAAVPIIRLLQMLVS